MEDEFYCILKLVSGEEIFSLISVDDSGDDVIIILQKPVTMNLVVSSNGQSLVKIKPWMEISNEDIFFIKLDKVITMTESRDIKLIELYEYYHNDDSIDLYKPYGKVNIDNEMGYVDTVQKARDRLESLFNENS